MGFDTHLATVPLAYSMSAYCMWDAYQRNGNTGFGKMYELAEVWSTC